MERCAAITTCGIGGSIATDAEPSPAHAEVELVAGEAILELAGQPARLLTYNGRFPGPLIRAREGQQLLIRLTNRLAEPTNLHFHGLHVLATAGSFSPRSPCSAKTGGQRDHQRTAKHELSDRVSRSGGS